MSILTAVAGLILIVLVIDLGLTAGIIRRLRHAPATSYGEPETAPGVGHRIDLALDTSPWPVEASRMLTGPVLVAFVLPGCSGCERLRRELDDAGPVSVPFILVGDPNASDPTMMRDYLDSWTDAAGTVVAPDWFDALESFARPSSFPTLVVANDGVVVASGHRYEEVRDAADRLGKASTLNFR